MIELSAGKANTKYKIHISKTALTKKVLSRNIDKDKKILVMCAAGGRSLIAAKLLEAEGYSTFNVSDGFSGNGQDPGWKNLGLPSVINN